MTQSRNKQPSSETGYKAYFGLELAERLARDIQTVTPEFPREDFLADVASSELLSLELLGRVDLLAALLRRYLPEEYPDALTILESIYGPENPNETGMFTFGYWLWPVASFIAHYGLDHYDRSISSIRELTKRHTGEHAIRPYIRTRPTETTAIMLGWAASDNVHVRRLASEGLRPRLPWSKRLDLFIDDPAPVFAVLEALRDDPSKFVQKSVANNVNDYLKDNRQAAMELLDSWTAAPTPQRRWIIRHALRNEIKREADDALALLVRSEA